jgi:hypothetical protein
MVAMRRPTGVFAEDSGAAVPGAAVPGAEG